MMVLVYMMVIIVVVLTQIIWVLYTGYFAVCSNNSCETLAQNAGLSSSSFNQPLNTSINLTLGLEIVHLFIPNGTQVAAFYDLNQDGIINTNPLVTSNGQVYWVLCWFDRL